MDRVTAEDEAILWPDPQWPQEVGALAILDGATLLDGGGGLRPAALAEAADVIAGRIHRVPRLRQLLHTPPRLLGAPVWVDDPAFDVARHVRLQPLPASAGEPELVAAVEQILRTRLDRTKPLWEAWLLPGLPGGRVGLFFRLHHVIADGIAAMAILGTFLDAHPGSIAAPPSMPPPPVPPPPVHTGPPWSPASPPGRGELFVDSVLRQLHRMPARLAVLRHPWSAGRSARTGWQELHRLVEAEPAPGTILDHPVGDGRRLALFRVRLATVVAVAHASGGTVNDVLLTVVGGALRRWLVGHGESVDGRTLPVYVPKTLRTGGLDEARGNQIAQLVVPVPIGLSDPEERLARIIRETRARKSQPALPIGGLVGRPSGQRLLLRVLQHHPVSVTTADLVGPSTPRWFAGAELIEVFPILPLVSAVTVGVGALSYAGTLSVTFVVDADTVPDPGLMVAGAAADLAVLADRLGQRPAPRVSAS
ncbi:MAG TPA: wax ester/triacylglycerol synthase domain-containing protein [Microlunatus sp.]|nr:wax ester/triacylglycerol synthase domain-containing protein [Microlunatus sp.]